MAIIHELKHNEVIEATLVELTRWAEMNFPVFLCSKLISLKIMLLTECDKTAEQ